MFYVWLGFQNVCISFSPCFEPSRNKYGKEGSKLLPSYILCWVLDHMVDSRLKQASHALQNIAICSEMEKCGTASPPQTPCKTTLSMGYQTSTSERPHGKAMGFPAGLFSRTLTNHSSPLSPVGSSSFQVGHVLLSVFVFILFFFLPYYVFFSFFFCLTILVSRQPSDVSVIYIFPSCLMSYFPVIFLNRVEKASTVKSA